MNQSQLYNIPHITSLAAQYHVTPSKQFGQNYLISERAIHAILGAADLHKEDVVVEVGPGFGVLTFAVLPHVHQVQSFEIEKRLEPYWDEVCKNNNTLSVVWGNALKTVPQHLPEKGLYKVVANLPYQITSRILRLFLEAKTPPERMVVMVQKEVAERICATPGNMSVLAIAVQYVGVPKTIAKVPRTAFWPEPKVDSAVLAITGIAQKDPKERDAFFRTVKAGFASKRKQLWHNLVSGLHVSPEHAKHCIEEVTGNAKIRAQELGVEEWKQLIGVLGIQ